MTVLPALQICSLSCLQGRAGVGSLFAMKIKSSTPSRSPPANRGRSKAIGSLSCLQGRAGVGSLFAMKIKSSTPPNLPLQAGGGAGQLAPSPACRGGLGWGRSLRRRSKAPLLPTSPASRRGAKAADFIFVSQRTGSRVVVALSRWTDSLSCHCQRCVICADQTAGGLQAQPLAGQESGGTLDCSIHGFLQEIQSCPKY
jgi:hypothetical protein